jgi:hypothetical protein
MRSLIAAVITAFIILVVAIVGSAVARAGDQIPNTEIIVVKQGSGERFVARTDDSGSFSLKGLPIGDYTITISEGAFRRSIAGWGGGTLAVADFTLKITASRSPLNPVGVRRYFVGIPVSVGDDGTISGSLASAYNVKGPRDAGSGMASGK